jgi:hypothetical protein
MSDCPIEEEWAFVESVWVLINDAREEGFGRSGDRGGMGDGAFSRTVLWDSDDIKGSSTDMGYCGLSRSVRAFVCGALAAAGVVIPQTVRDDFCGAVKEGIRCVSSEDLDWT